ncbi:ankyrin repeat-containing-like protein [Cinnamomum micranthum f. kanehirae]|uniref:Ankyrin repeat-containing-like protein n=1 Tax=Cinnamomum micranthum f. kanehirae TaxID=337451 RepID=A0A443P288_9MAGN|nr:ankyrin repeat-containing-like protein [Cinnamomum micranthum f. kanehirae]
MDGKLYEAAITGNVSQLHELLREDANILDRLLFGGAVRENPLHIAARFGHSNFVREISSRKLEFARESNSQGRCPLHVASERGHVEVVKVLLERDADVCFVRDGEGRTPLHMAAMRGRLKVLEELVRVRPTAAWVPTDQGDPILHLCVNHGQWEAFKMLVGSINDNNEFLKLKDRDDNTILHLLAARAEYKDVKLLVDRLKTEEGVVNSMNVNGSTALDIAKAIRTRYGRFKIRRTLRKFGAKKGKEISRNRPKNRTSSKPQLEGSSNDSQSRDKSQDALMVVAILIATVTYGGALNPPGGVWQDDKMSDCSSSQCHNSGEAIMSYNFPIIYFFYSISNTIAFLVSSILILMLVSRSSFRRRVLKRYLTVMTWIAVSSMLLTYCLSAYTLCKEDLKREFKWIVGPVIFFGWILIIALLLVSMLHFAKSLIRIIGIKRLFDWMLSLLSRSRDSEDQRASPLHSQPELQQVVTTSSS